MFDEFKIIKQIRKKNMRKKNILITGGTGFIGSNLAKMLVKKNFNIKIYDNYSRQSSKNFNNLPKQIKITPGGIKWRLDDLARLYSEVLAIVWN